MERNHFSSLKLFNFGDGRRHPGGAAVMSVSGQMIAIASIYLLFLWPVPILSVERSSCDLYEYTSDDEDDDEDEDESVAGYEPSFDVPIVNVTVVTGQTAVLPCSIEYLGKHKVAWLDVKSVPLTYEDRRVVDDFRFSVVRPIVKEWNLQIRDIRYEDQGQYRCTINTLPVKSKLVTLHVKVPAAIIDNLSSNDLTVKEGENVVLVCNVTGVPKPEVTWYHLRPDGERDRIGQKGEMMIIRNITRHCTDIFECLASNGVPPSVSRQMKVTVEFKPEVTLPNKRLGQRRGKETILDCSIAANPQAISYWEKDGVKVSGGKYSIDAYEEGRNNIVLSLRISSVDDSDWGVYKCVASNSLGSDEATMVLYEYPHNDDLFRKTSRLPTTTDHLFLTSVSRPFLYFHLKNQARQGAQVFKPFPEFSAARYSSSAATTNMILLQFVLYFLAKWSRVA